MSGELMFGVLWQLSVDELNEPRGDGGERALWEMSPKITEPKPEIYSFFYDHNSRIESPN